MRFGINLRGDLAKLSDIAIAAKFEALLAEREAMYVKVPSYVGNKWFYQRGWGAWFGRGPLHAPIFYKLLGFQALLGSFNRPSLYDLYLLDCELKDTRDELNRRVKRQKTTMATA
jgi:hypothetical protein